MRELLSGSTRPTYCNLPAGHDGEQHEDAWGYRWKRGQVQVRKPAGQPSGDLFAPCAREDLQ